MSLLQRVVNREWFALRGAGTLAAGVLVAQVAGVVAMPILTRLYDPQAFGAYGMLVALVVAVSPIAALRLDVAVPLPVDREEGWRLVVLGAIASLGLAAILELAIQLAGKDSTNLFRTQFPHELLSWIPMLLLATGFFQLGSAWHVRERRPQVAATGRAVQGLMTAATQVVLGVAGLGSAGLLIGDLGGRMAAVWRVSAGGRPQGSWTSDLMLLVWRYRGFATFSSLAALANSVNASLPLLVVGSSRGATAAGLLLVAQRMASIPTTLLATSVSQVFAVELARLPAGEARASLYRTTLRKLTIPSVLAFGVIAAVTPIFNLLFGSSWGTAGSIALAFIPFYAAQLLSAATIVAVDVMQAHLARLVRELVYLVGVVVILDSALRANFGLAALAWLLSGFGLIYYGASLYWVHRRLRREQT